MSSSSGFKIAIIDDPAGFFEDCANVDLVVTHRDAPNVCAAKAVIDAEALASGGVHWLRWTGQGFETRPAITGLKRPWRAAR